MKIASVINALMVLGAIFFLYISYGYYIERTMRMACEDSEVFLANLANTMLPERIKDFDTPPEKVTQNYLSPKLTEIRRIHNISDPIALSELEALYLILGDYLEPEGCNLFTNLAAVSQAKTVLLYTQEFRKGNHTLFLGEIEDLPRKSNIIDHVSPPTACGLEIDNHILQKEEPEYCKAIHEQNYRVVKELELQVDKDDEVSQVYKSLLANCFADCLNKEITCVEDCWKRKLS